MTKNCPLCNKNIFKQKYNGIEYFSCKNDYHEYIEYTDSCELYFQFNYDFRSDFYKKYKRHKWFVFTDDQTSKISQLKINYINFLNEIILK